MDVKKWLKIGQHAEREHLSLVAGQLQTKWPGRFDLRIVSTVRIPGSAAKHYELLLKHR